MTPPAEAPTSQAVTPKTKIDPRAEYRGQWDVGGNWWCDCPAKNDPARYRCKRCGIYRPLKGSQVYELRDSAQGTGFMYKPKLVPVDSESTNV